MRIVVATAEGGGGPYDGVFWQSYLEAGAPEPAAILLLSDSQERGFVRKLVESFLLFEPSEVARLTSATRFGLPLTDEDRRRGLHHDLRDLFSDEKLRRVDSLNSDVGRTLLEDLAPDLLVSVGSPEIFDRSVLEIPHRTCLNVHNGRLPDYRGMFGTFWEMYAGDREGWITIHEMTPEVDAGHILAERSVPLGDSLFEALVRKKQTGGRLLGEILTDLEEIEGTAQGDRHSEEDYFSWPTLGDMWRLRVGSAPVAE